MRNQHHLLHVEGLQTAIAAVKNLHAANHCHSLHCWESLCKSRGVKQALPNAGYFIICFTPSCCISVYLLSLTKRSKERRCSWRGAAGEPDGPTLPSLGIVSLSVTLVFLSPPAPLGPICTFLFLHVCHVVFQFSLPRKRCLCCRVPHSELSRPMNGTPLDPMTICLRGAEISQDCFLARAKLCAELSWEAPWRGPVQRSHHCSHEIALKELVFISQAFEKCFCTAFTLHLFPTLACPFPSQACLSLSLPIPSCKAFSHTSTKKQRAQQREFLFALVQHESWMRKPTESYYPTALTASQGWLQWTDVSLHLLVIW